MGSRRRTEWRRSVCRGVSGLVDRDCMCSECWRWPQILRRALELCLRRKRGEAWMSRGGGGRTIFGWGLYVDIIRIWRRAQRWPNVLPSDLGYKYDAQVEP